VVLPPCLTVALSSCIEKMLPPSASGAKWDSSGTVPAQYCCCCCCWWWWLWWWTSGCLVPTMVAAPGGATTGKTLLHQSSSLRCLRQPALSLAADGCPARTASPPSVAALTASHPTLRSSSEPLACWRALRWLVIPPLHLSMRPILTLPRGC
jgi:hypothetical protein